MVNLYENLGKSADSPLETAGVGFDTASVSLEPGHGVVKRGTVLYRKSAALYAPAAAANILNTNQLVVLREDVDTDASATVAALGDVIVAGGLLAQYVLLSDGSKEPAGLPESNVLYFDLENDSWCCARPSGTEPKIKFYMGVKGDSLQDAQEKLTALTNALLEAVKQD